MENLYKYMSVFILCSIVGFIVKTLWYKRKPGKIESRKSLLYDPFNVVYAIGGVTLTIVLKLCGTDSFRRTFLRSFAVGTGVEYICSFLQKWIFGSVSWDYKEFPLNINGRVCLR